MRQVFTFGHKNLVHSAIAKRGEGGAWADSLREYRTYDMEGRPLSVASETRWSGRWTEAGTHEALFDGTGYASGVYFFQLHGGGKVQTRKMVLLH